MPAIQAAAEKIWLKDQELADRLGVSRVTVWKWSRTLDEFPKPVTIGPKTTRWRLSEVEDYESARLARGNHEARRRTK